MRRLLALVAAMFMVAGMAAFAAGQDDKPGAGQPAVNAAFTYEKLRDMSDARAYTGAPAKGFKLGYGNLSNQIPLSNVVQESIRQEWILAGGSPADFIALDNKVDPQAATDNAEILLGKGVNAIIEFQAFEKANAMIARRAKDMSVFVVGIDIPVAGFPFMGVDNYGVSQLTGQWVADNIDKIYGGWNKVDLVMVMWHPQSGEQVTWRTRGAADLLAKKYGASAVLDGKGSKVISVRAVGTAESGQQAVLDALAAHPDAKNIITFQLNDPEASGVIEGAKLAGRWDPKKWTVMSSGYDDTGKELVAKGEITGDVDFNFDKYGRYCVPGVLAYLHGNPVPASMYVDMSLATRKQ